MSIHVPDIKLDRELDILFALCHHATDIQTPVFICDEKRLTTVASSVIDQLRDTHAQVLYPLKPFSQVDVLRALLPHISGFSVSSLFEARLITEAIDEPGTIHFTSPGLPESDIAELTDLCTHVSLNSLTQLARWPDPPPNKVSLGLRVNPQLSYVQDARYDPSRPYSKLGAPLNAVKAAIDAGNPDLDRLDGIHFHSNCESTDFGELLRTVQHLEESIGDLLQRVKWINLGGGYLFEEAEYIESFHTAVDHLQKTYDLEVFIEPGTALVRSAGYVVSTVLDIFESDGLDIAVLDTTVNHMPEVFEYGYEPDVFGHDEKNEHEYQLAGTTCLAGDLFGIYKFDKPLELGSRIIFLDQGAYTLPKAHMFNGVNLPSIYALTADGELVLKKQFTYDDYASRWRTDSFAPA